MAKIWVQHNPVAWEVDTNLATSGSVSSGSFSILGYTQLVGQIFASGSGFSATCSLRIRESPDAVPNWDHTTSCGLTANSASKFSIELAGRYADITYFGDTTTTTASVRAFFKLRPI